MGTLGGPPVSAPGGGGGGSIVGQDHGLLAGLADDDHTQYLKEKASGGLAAEIPTHTHADAANAGTIDHGALTGLGDDDHSIYALNTHAVLTAGADARLSAEVNVQAMQLVNEVKGWPPIVNTGDLDALNLWWDKVGTPSTAPSVVAVSGEGGVTETYELALKVVTDAASEGLSQRYTYADEPRLKLGRVCSALVAIWSVGAISITAKLVNSDASETAAAAVTAAAWTIVEIPNHTLAGTYVDLQVTAGASGTFYVVPLGLCIGTRGLSLQPRPSRYVEVPLAWLINDVDAGAAWTDADATAATSPLCWRVNLYAFWQNSAVAKQLSIRRNGDTYFGGGWSGALVTSPATQQEMGRGDVCVDDGQIFEFYGSDVAANTEHIYIALVGWWEWS